MASKPSEMRIILRHYRAYVIATAALQLAAGVALCIRQPYVAGAAFVLAYLLWGCVVRREDERTRAMTWEHKKLLAAKGPAAVGDLALVLAIGHQADARQAAQNSLLKLLPTVDRQVYDELDASERDAMREVCSSTASVPLALALLHAFERLEDTDALPHVQRIADGRCRAAGDARVTEAARSCLGALSAASARERQVATLLRPADGAPTDTLLRPAGGAPKEPAEQLLRPAPAGGADQEEHTR